MDVILCSQTLTSTELFNKSNHNVFIIKNFKQMTKFIKC